MKCTVITSSSTKCACASDKRVSVPEDRRAWKDACDLRVACKVTLVALDHQRQHRIRQRARANA
eukprot:1710786-Rhodomonas_salina.1